MNTYKPAIAGLAAAILVGGMPGPTATAEEAALVEAGRKHFIRCTACHSTRADAPPNIGPHLEGIVGRTVAAVAGFNYSDAMRAQTFVWDEAQLDRWLEHPQADIPGLCMPFKGLSKPEARKALIAYLKNPTP